MHPERCSDHRLFPCGCIDGLLREERGSEPKHQLGPRPENISLPAPRLDHILFELLPKPVDEYFKHVAVFVGI